MSSSARPAEPSNPGARPNRRLGRSDFAIAALLGAAFAASPLTGAARLAPSLAGGALVGLGALALLRRRPAVAPDASAASVPPLAWGVLGLAAILTFPTAVALFDWYRESVWRNAHGMLLPLVMIGLAARTLRSDPDRSAASSAWGYLPLALGSAALVIDSGVQTLVLSTLGLVSLLLGLSLLLLGPRRTRGLALPLALGLFLLPLPTSLTTYTGLQTGSAIGAQHLLDAIGVPVLRSATVLQLSDNQYAVSANCSGFSALYAAVAVAVVLAAHCRSWARAVLLLAAVWPLVVVANSVRQAALVLACERGGIALLHSPLHGISGIATVFAVWLGLAMLAGRRTIRETFA